MMALDHGYLNLLRKRGNIDAEIDAYKAERRREEKARRLAARALVKQARAEVRKLTDFRLAQLGAPYKLTVLQTRRMMLSAADSRPAMVIASMSREAH